MTQYRKYLDVLCHSLDMYIAMFCQMNQTDSEQTDAITATAIQILKYYPKEYVASSPNR